jgi:hypothetical protein
VNIDGTPHSIIAVREPADGSADSTQSTLDQEYHQARERAERRAAKEASSVQSRRVHQELAQAHARAARHGAWPRGH